MPSVPTLALIYNLVLESSTTFNGLDISSYLCGAQLFRLEPIGYDELSSVFQDRERISEEELFIRQMTHHFRYPHSIKRGVIWSIVKVVAHFLGVQFQEAHLSITQ